MKLAAIAIFALLACASARSVDDHDHSAQERLFKDVVQNYRGEAKEYAKDGLKHLAESICENKSTDLETPFNEVVQRAEQVDTEHETVCNLIKNKLEHVLEPLVNAVDRCLPNDEAGVFDYTIKAIVSSVTFICQSDGEHILELVNPCLEEIDFENSNCVQDIQQKWNDITTTASKSFKEEICSSYNDARPCLSTEVHSKCKLQITQDAMLGFADSVFKTPCA